MVQIQLSGCYSSLAADCPVCEESGTSKELQKSLEHLKCVGDGVLLSKWEHSTNVTALRMALPPSQQLQRVVKTSLRRLKSFRWFPTLPAPVPSPRQQH